MASATVISHSPSSSITLPTSHLDHRISFPAANPPNPSPQKGRATSAMSIAPQRTKSIMQPAGSLRPHGDVNGAIRHGSTPQIYSAVYSGVNVYEMEVNGIAVMRRRNDSWLNATQILKVAGVEKGKRTKVLEKEILIGEHEKVQGGYGKYQGTWIKFDRGLEFCRQYGVEDMLRPLLTYDMGQDGGIAGQGDMDTPTKEQAMAAQRKRLYNSGGEGRSNVQSGTFFKNISSTASHAVAAISKARFDSPGPRIRNGNMSARPASFSRQSSQQHLDSQDPGYPGGSQQSMASFASENSFNMNGGHESAYSTQSVPQFSQNPSQADFQEPPRKRIRPSPSIHNSQQAEDGIFDVSLRDVSPTEPNESFVYHQNSQNMEFDNEDPVAVPPFPMQSSKTAETNRALLMSLFMDPSRLDFTNHEVFLSMSGDDLDMPIDNSAHTALHWAATLARMPLLKALIASGANIYRVDVAGDTALMRACAVTNNHDMSSFPELLDLLGPSIELKDGRGRTVLHHIAVTSAVKGRSQASKYYLESLLEFVVRQGSAPNSQQSFLGAAPPRIRSMGIGRFMSEIVNAQDKSGDTALNIAARIGNRSIISQLLEVGADASIPNRAGLRPLDFGIGDPADAADRTVGPSGSPDKAFGNNPRETSGDIISSITTLLSSTEREFVNEMTSKQAVIDSIHVQLRDSSAQLGEERRRLSALQIRRSERDELKGRTTNLSRAAREETFHLSQIQRSQKHLLNGTDTLTANSDVRMRLGDADAALTLSPSVMSHISHAGGKPDGDGHGHGGSNSTPTLLALGELPAAHVLKLRVNAYAANGNAVGDDVRGLKGKSSELEAKYKKVVSICTKVEEDRVDGLLEKLCRAVDSEQDQVELGRVREFLQRVEGVD